MLMMIKNDDYDFFVYPPSFTMQIIAKIFPFTAPKVDCIFSRSNNDQLYQISAESPFTSPVFSKPHPQKNSLVT